MCIFICLFIYLVWCPHWIHTVVHWVMPTITTECRTHLILTWHMVSHCQHYHDHHHRYRLCNHHNHFVMSTVIVIYINTQSNEMNTLNTITMITIITTTIIFLSLGIWVWVTRPLICGLIFPLCMVSVLVAEFKMDSSVVDFFKWKLCPDGELNL